MCLGPARARASHEKRVVRRQLPARRVEAKDEDAIEPIVGHCDEAAGRIEHVVMMFRPFLPLYCFKIAFSALWKIADFC